MYTPATITLIACLFLLAVAVLDHAGRRHRIPVSGWVLLLGLAYGVTARLAPGRLPEVSLSPPFVVYALLPLFLFNAARTLHPRSLLAEASAICFLALAGLAAGMVFLALPLVVLGGVGWTGALLFGAALSATDPTALGSALRNARLPERLHAMVEGASLSGDALAVIAFSILSAALFDDAELGVAKTAGGVALSLAGAAALGTLTGTAAGGLLRYWRDLHDRFIGAAIPLVAVYGTFAAAHSLGRLSGVVAVAAATLAMGSMHIHRGAKTPAQQRADDFFAGFWKFLDTLATAVLFFGIGALVGQHPWLLPWSLVPAGCAALLLARLVSVYPVGPAMAATGRPVPAGWRHVIAASGLRGGVPVALLLAIPPHYAHRNAMLCLAFVLLLFALAVHALTLQRATRAAGLQPDFIKNEGPSS